MTLCVAIMCCLCLRGLATDSRGLATDSRGLATDNLYRAIAPPPAFHRMSCFACRRASVRPVELGHARYSAGFFARAASRWHAFSAAKQLSEQQPLQTCTSQCGEFNPQKLQPTMGPRHASSWLHSTPRQQTSRRKGPCTRSSSSNVWLSLHSSELATCAICSRCVWPGAASIASLSSQGPRVEVNLWSAIVPRRAAGTAPWPLKHRHMDIPGLPVKSSRGLLCSSVRSSRGLPFGSSRGALPWSPLLLPWDPLVGSSRGLPWFSRVLPWGPPVGP